VSHDLVSHQRRFNPDGQPGRPFRDFHLLTSRSGIPPVRAAGRRQS
jgi:hypothetical protein